MAEPTEKDWAIVFAMIREAMERAAAQEAAIEGANKQIGLAEAADVDAA